MSATPNSGRARWTALLFVMAVAASGAVFAEPAGTASTPVFSPSAVYDGAGFSNLRGGTRRGSTYSGNLNLRVFANGEAAFGWPESLAYVDALWVHGGQPSNFVGDAQGVSNISAQGVVEVYEAWLQKNAVANRFSVLAGLYDINVEFYNLQAASLFINSSFGIGPEFSGSGVEGPSIFPKTAVGLRFAAKPTIDSVVRLGILNGVPYDRPDGSHAIHKKGDGVLVVAEAAFIDRPAKAERPPNRRFRIGRHDSANAYDDKLAIGGWYYTAAFDDLADVRPDGTSVRRRGSGGYYALGQVLLSASKTAPAQRVSAFAQAGVGDARTDRFGSYVGAGLTAAGLGSMPADDEVGLALAVARNGSHYLALQNRLGLLTTRTEKAIDFTYLHTVNSHIYIQPDLQYVVHPNTNPRVRNALALQLRFEIGY